MTEISRVKVGTETAAFKDAEARSEIGNVGAVLDDILGLDGIGAELDAILGGDVSLPGSAGMPISLPISVRRGTSGYRIGVADDEKGLDLFVERSET